MDFHEILIDLHAAAGLIAFFSGCLIIRPRNRFRTGLFAIYLSSLWIMIGMVIAAVIYDWHRISQIIRIIYVGLIILAVYTGFRGWQAGRIRKKEPYRPDLFIDHTGFTLISLFDGFVIVSALDLHAPDWLVTVIGVTGVLTGIRAVNAIKKRYTGSS